MDGRKSSQTHKTARVLPWVLGLALSLWAGAGLAEALTTDLMTDGLGYSCAPKGNQSGQRRCIADPCTHLDQTGLAKHLHARPLPAQWADYQARYHAICHRRDWQPAPAPRPADLTHVPDRCILSHSRGRGIAPRSRAVLYTPDGRERVYPTDWAARFRVPPSQWATHPGFATAGQLLPSRRLSWGRAPAPVGQGAERAIWVPDRARPGGGHIHTVGFGGFSCVAADTDVTSAVPPPALTPVPLPGGALHLMGAMGALAMLRRRGLHRQARRA